MTPVFYDGVVDLAQRNDPRTRMVEAVRPGSRVLEVGCATGFVGEHLVRERNCQHLGIEIEPDAAARARARGLEVIVGNVEDPSVVAGINRRFDHVLFGDVIEHLADPRSVVARLKGVLDPGGTMVASIPNVAHWSVRWHLLLGRFDYTPGGLLDQNHLRFFTARTAVALFEEQGLSVAQVDVVYAFPLRLPLPHPVKHRIAKALPGLFTWQFVIETKPR